MIGTGPNPSDDGHLFYQMPGLFVPLEDAGLDEAGQSVSDVSGGGGTDALDRLAFGGRGGGDLRERAEALDQTGDQRFGELLGQAVQHPVPVRGESSVQLVAGRG